MRLVDGCAVVTGGGSGIGRAIAEALAAAGVPVAVVDLMAESGKDAVGKISGAGGKATFVQGDVSRWSDVDAAVDTAVRQLGPLGILVNAAGILDGYAPMEELTPSVWERVIAINLGGTFFGCKRALVEMVPRGEGRIVNIASVAGLNPGGSSIGYATSKAGLIHLTRCLAVALAPEVSVNCVAPGLMEGTRMTSRLRPETAEGARQRAVLKRAASVEDVADQVVAFCRTDSVTGQVLNVDAGVFFH